MATTVVRVYDRLSNAQHARSQLLQSGFPSSSVSLSATEDEAGPMEGNGVVDEKDTGTGPRGKSLRAMPGSEERTDAYNNSEPEWRSSILLTVDATDDEQRARACGIMDSCGAIDVDARTDSYRNSQ
jgi:hypothetical protein